MPATDAGAMVGRLAALQPVMGITRLADITGLDRIGLPVFVAIRPNSRSIATSQGKGLTPDAARVAALMEAAETWHAERVEAPLRLAAVEDLSGRVIELDRLPLRAHTHFDHGRPLLWLRGSDLGAGDPIWLPFELVHTDYRLPQPACAGCFPIGTNGLAAGGSRAEALRHALCELIERDALSIWQQARRRPTAWRSVGEPECRRALESLAAAGFAVALLDITSDIGIPTYLAVLADERDPLGHPGLGSACHPEAPTALLKALLEAVQVRTSYIAGARDDLDPDEFGAAGRRAKLRWIEPLLRASRAGQDLPLPPTVFGQDAPRQVEFLLERLATRGMRQAVAVDLDRPEVGLSVVRVIVPGLEGCADDPGYVPGRRALAARAA